MYIPKSYKEFVVSAFILLMLDATYITTTSKLYNDQIVNVQRVVMKVKPVGAIICYAFIILGLYYFIISKKRPMEEAFLFGLVVYGVYDATNYATLKKWSPYLAIMDTIWGGTLFALTTQLTYFITHG